MQSWACQGLSEGKISSVYFRKEKKAWLPSLAKDYFIDTVEVCMIKSLEIKCLWRVNTVFHVHWCAVYTKNVQVNIVKCEWQLKNRHSSFFDFHIYVVSKYVRVDRPTDRRLWLVKQLLPAARCRLRPRTVGGAAG